MERTVRVSPATVNRTFCPAKPMPKSGFDGKRTQPGHTGRFEKK